MKQPLVSIQIPAYRHARYIGAAIESVLAQTCGDFELFVLDDCSPDETYEIARSYKDPRLTVIRQEYRSGTSSNANVALRLSRGRYIAGCSSDDRWLPDRLQRDIAYLESRPQVGALFSRPWLIDDAGRRLPDTAHVLGGDIGAAGFSRADWLALMFHVGNMLCGTTLLARADAVRATGEFNPLLLQLQDFDYWVRLLCKYEISWLPERMVEYRVNSGGANLSTPRADSLGRTAWEFYQVLKHYADGAAADAVVARPLQGEPLFTWRPARDSRELQLAVRSLQLAASVPNFSFGHFMFALDCMQAHAQREGGLLPAEGEGRLMTLPFFEVSGSSIAQNFFIGVEGTRALNEMIAAMTGQSAAPQPAAPSPAPAPPAGGLFGRLFGRNS